MALPDLELAVDVARLPPRPSARPSAAPGAGVPPLEAAFAAPRAPSQRPDAAELALDVEVPAPRRRSIAPTAPLLVRIARPTGARPPSGFGKRFLYDTPLVNGAALPAALGLGLVTYVIGMFNLVHMTVLMWFHELGHAVAAWFAGFLAIPLPFVTVWPTDERNILVILLVVAAWSGLGYLGYRKKRWALVGAAVAMALLQGRMTLLMSPGRAFQWVIFSGLGGEIVLCTLLMLAFYQRLPWRWDFWRYPLLFGAGLAYMHALLRWIGIPLGWARMPSGSAVGDKSDGDVERLIRTKEFTEQALARTYLVMALLALVMLGLTYAFYLQRARRRVALGLGPDEDDGEDDGRED